MPEPIQSTPVQPPPVHTEPEAPFTPLPPVTVVASPPLSDLALGCLKEIDAAVIPFLAGAPNPLVGFLVGFKTGADLGECVNERIAEASLHAAVEMCKADGGTPTGVVENVVTCEVVKP
jgi:hypothetical protein